MLWAVGLTARMASQACSAQQFNPEPAALDAHLRMQGWSAAARLRAAGLPTLAGCPAAAEGP